MHRLAYIGVLVSCCGMISAPTGCTRDQQNSAPPASQPIAAPIAPEPDDISPPKPEPGPLLPGSDSWTRAEALANLCDDDLQLSAAVRLARLADVAPLWAPDPLPEKLARRIRVAALSDARWAAGLAVGDDDRRLAAPVFIDNAGEVTPSIDGVEGELSVLCCSEHPELFPHMLITPARVLLVGEELQTVIVAKSLPACRFDVRDEDGYWYLALVLRPPADASDRNSDVVEVARYEYDPFESAFMGPLIDKLPDPPGGKFELDLEQSIGLVPVGGQLPEPPEPDPPVVPDEFGPTPF